MAELLENVESAAGLTVLGASSVPGARAQLLTEGVPGRLVDGLHPRGYLDRLGDAPVAGLRPVPAARTDPPVAFGRAPRLRRRTGQFHRGGPSVGSFPQITGAVERDPPVPGRPYTFGELQAAQAVGDREALTGPRPTASAAAPDRSRSRHGATVVRPRRVRGT